MKDKYLYFTFDGINSSYYNCFYINNGEDLSFPAFPQFSDNTSSPLFQQHTYYLGTSINNRTFTFNCACDLLDIQDFKKIQTWLAIDKISTLKLDFLELYHFNVKVSSLSNILFLPQSNNKFYCTFTVDFTTIEDYAAISDKQYSWNIKKPEEAIKILDPTYKIPIIDGIYESKRYGTPYYSARFFNCDSYSYYPIFEVSNSRIFRVGRENEKYLRDSNNINILYDYVFTNNLQNLKIDGRLGFVTLNDELIEQFILKQDSITMSSSTNNGGCEIITSSIQQEEGILLKSSYAYTADGRRGVQLVFSLNNIQLFDYGEKNDYGILENSNYRGIFIQEPSAINYNFYNKEGYNEDKYWVNPIATAWSYHFFLENNTLKIIILPNCQNFLETVDELLQYYKIGDSYLLSILKYTELNFGILTSTFVDNSTITKAQLDSTEIKFNLRTVF